MTFGISGASGNLGRLTAEELLRSIPGEEVVLTTRTPEALSDLAEQGATVRFADFDDPASLPTAFAGIDRLFIVSASNGTGKRKDQHSGAIKAATAAGVQRVVFPSMPNVSDPAHPVGLAAEEYREAEEAVRAEAREWTILRNGPYVELHVVERLPELVGAGRVVTNSGEGRLGFISRSDCAAAAAGVLTGGDEHHGHTYDVTGPQALSWRDVAELLTELTGTDVPFEPVDDAAYAEILSKSGMPDLLVEALVGMGVAVREGWFDVQTEDFEKITGRPAGTLREVLAGHFQTVR